MGRRRALAPAACYEQWLAYTAHGNGLAVFRKNDGAPTATKPVNTTHVTYKLGSGDVGDQLEAVVTASNPAERAVLTVPRITRDGSSGPPRDQ